MSVTTTQGTSQHAALGSREAFRIVGATTDATCSPPPPQTKVPCTSTRLSRNADFVLDFLPASPSTPLFAETKYALTVNASPGTPSQTSAAAAFFARAAQKLNLTSLPHRRKRLLTEEESAESGTSGCERSSCGEGGCGRSFRKVLLRQPPPVPPALLRRIGVREVTGVGKVKVMLKVCRNFVPDITEPRLHRTFKNVTSTPTSCADEHYEMATPTDVDNVKKSTSLSFFSIDARKKQVTLFDPAACGGSSAPEDRRVGVAAPKMFTFDAIFTHEDSQAEICANSLSDLIHAVINGMDGCLFCFGHSKLGKTTTMVGTPDSSNTLGTIPCAISWLFRSINEQKQKTGARFSVRVSAVEVVGPSQQLKDLLADHATDSEQSPGVYLRDDPLFGTTLQNQSELRVPTAEKAAFYLDAAVSNRTNKEEMKESHMLYTLHVYQYSVAGKGGVAGGRSRLHLIDLGSCERGKASGGIPLSGLGNVLLAIFNGQKHLPYRDHKITQLLKECLSSLTCHAAMIVHVSPYAQHYYDTLATIQLASRIHRMRRRKIKLWTGSTGSGGSSGEEASRVQTQDHGRSTGSSDVDPSSSEQSADTVIYVGPSDEATDGEHPPVYIPSLNSGDNRCAMSKALRGSGAEHRPTVISSRSHLGKSSHSSSPSSPKVSCDYLDDRNNLFIRCSSNKSNSTTSVSKALFGHLNTYKSSSGCISTNVSNNKPLENGNSALSGTVNNKVSLCASNITTVPGSDEQWIDGPRISKMKVAEAWNLLKDNYKKKETWIDGPMQVTKDYSSMSYGFMDNHKKNMIRKWVENQTVQIQKQTGKNIGGQSCAQLVIAQAVKDANQGSCTTENKELKKLTASRNADTEIPEKGISSMALIGTNISERFLLEDMALLRLPDGGVDKAKQLSDAPYSSSDTSTVLSKKDILTKRDKEQSESRGSNENSTSIEEMSSCKKINADMVVKCPYVDAQPLLSEPGEFDEIIEVSESYETVPMQDCSLQVTEEDIAICMGKVENPLPEVDQETLDEHPLRILSEENLTIVSTFTDSLSVTTDVDVSLPSHQLGIGLSPNHSLSSTHTFDWGQHSENAVSHTDLRRSFSEEVKEKHKLNVNSVKLTETNHGFSQLSKLHEMYRHKLARVNATKTSDNSLQPGPLNHSSRYQSLSLIDILQSQCYPKSDFRYIDTNTLHSEPTYIRSVDRVTLEHAKICNNCKINLRIENNDILSHTPALNRQYPICDNVSDDVEFHSYGKIPDTSNISSLRHPDGASNPNLTEDVEKRLQQESPISDHKVVTRSKGKHSEGQNLSSKKGKSSFVAVKCVKDEDTPPVLPPPLFVPASSRFHKRFFTKGCHGLKSTSSHICPEGCDSEQDSSIFRLPKGDVLYLRFSGKVRPGCESSGYESIIRDSESSSFESSQDSDHSSRVEFHNSGKFVAVTGGELRTNSYKTKSSMKVPVLQYFKEDVDRLERRWMELKSGRIKDLKKEQEDLKEELAAAKSRLLIPRDRWSYELHVEASMDHRHPSFVEALQRETEILRKRVEACKSHILMATCFDSVIKSTED